MTARLLALTVVVLLGLAAPAVAQQQQSAPERGISVIGESETFADNDVAHFRFAVGVRRRTPGEALRATGAVVQRVIGAVRATGVAQADVRTDVVSLRRVRIRSRRTGRTLRIRYDAANAVRVTVRRLPDAGTVVDRAVAAGATNVSGPTFAVADAQAVYRRTLAGAFAEARRKAEQLAAEAGVTLGPPLEIRESGFDQFGAGAESPQGSDLVQGVAEEQAVPTPVAPGRTRITASVAVTFAVR